MLAMFCAAGCGGGQQGGASASSASHTSKAGEAEFTYFGQPKPMFTASSGSVSVLGQAGATFTAVTLEPPPNLDDTYLVFTRLVLNSDQLYKLPYSSSKAQLLYQGGGGSIFPGVSAYGTVAFNNTAASGDPVLLYSIRSDGTGLAQISFTGVPEPTGPHYSVDGTNRLTFTDGNDLFIGPGTGGAPTTVRTNAAPYALPWWNTAGTELIYGVPVGMDGNTDLYTTTTSGATTVDVTPTALQNTGQFYPFGWSADGVTILAEYTPSSSGISSIVKFPVNQPSDYTILTPSGDQDFEACFSPDGSKIAIGRSGTNGVTPGVYECDAAGLGQTLVLPDPSGAVSSLQGGISWSPFLPAEHAIATVHATFYSQSCSGFLLTQTGDQFGSLVAFTASTPSSAAIQAPAETSGSQPLIFTLTADSITELGYINTYFSPGTKYALTSTPTVVVTIDATTGQVDLVAPAAKPAGAPAKTADGYLTYNTRFTAIYDGTGKNLAPSGANQLVVNPKTGKLVSFR